MKIFIDAGHNYSGWNTGAVGNGMREQDITFAVAKKLGDLLKSQGLDIMLSRPTLETNLGTDNASSINTRIKMANDWAADYFISIHCNAGGGTGAETLYYKEDSVKYAKTIQKNYIDITKLRDRGIKYRSDVGVLKNTKMPAVLVETGFIDTLTDAQFLRDKQDVIAKAIASGFYELLNIKVIENGKESTEMRYKTLNDVPDWGKPTIEKLVKKGFLTGEGDNIDISNDMLRIFVVNDRAGLYGK